MGNTIKKFIRSTSRSLRKSGSVLDKSGYGAQKNVSNISFDEYFRKDRENGKKILE